MTTRLNICTILLLMLAVALTAGAQRKFISHRGVDLGCTIAGENSLQAIALARRAGFDCIETDVRLTADDSLVVMHDPTLNRTCLNLDGTSIDHPLPIDQITYTDLISNYRLKADSAAHRTQVPTLRQYLETCRRENIFTFIEPKLVDPTGSHYTRIIQLADLILGPGNYIITSNNRANNIIRHTMHNDSTPLMHILYKSTYAHTAALGHTIFAISASRIPQPIYSDMAARAHAEGYLTESHADRADRFHLINTNPIDYVSTDLLAPDYTGQGTVVSEIALDHPIKAPFKQRLAPSQFGALYLTISVDGQAEVTLGGQTFTVADTRSQRHQVITYATAPTLKVTPLTPNTTVTALQLKQVEY